MSDTVRVKVVCDSPDHSAELPTRDFPADACEWCGRSRLGGPGTHRAFLAPGERARIAREVVAERTEKMTEEDLFDMSESMEYATTKYSDREQVAALRRRIIRSFLKPPDAKTEGE